MIGQLKIKQLKIRQLLDVKAPGKSQSFQDSHSSKILGFIVVILIIVGLIMG
jgi:hypothetical protein